MDSIGWEYILIWSFDTDSNPDTDLDDKEGGTS